MNISRVPVLALTAVALAGCASTTSSGGSTPSVGGAQTTASVTPTPSHSVPPTTAITACEAADVRLTLSPAGAGAGHDYSNLIATNRTPRPCSLKGVPTVRHVTTKNHDVGSPAVLDTTHPAAIVVLKQGEQAAAVLDEANPYNFPAGECRLTVVVGVRVRLPGDTLSLVVPEASNTCANPKLKTFFVQPFTKDFQSVDAHP